MTTETTDNMDVATTRTAGLTRVLELAPVSALLSALALSDERAHHWLMRARCYLALGSIARARAAYEAASTRGVDVCVELQQLETLVATWLDHPSRLASLFPSLTRCTSPCGLCDLESIVRYDGTYAAERDVQVAWTIFRSSAPFRSSSKPPRAIVVFFHGNAETVDDLQSRAALFHEQQMVLMIVEYRGYGRSSQTPPLLSTLLSDAEPLLLGSALEDAMTAAHLPASLPLVLYGRSLGSHIAIHLAAMARCARCTVCALILEAGIASVRHWTCDSTNAPPEGQPRLPAGIAIGILENCAKLQETTTPLLVIHGDSDIVVPAYQVSLDTQHYLSAPSPHGPLR